MCCSDEQKKGKKGHHGPDQNPFRNKNVKGKTDKMVTDAIENVHTDVEEVHGGGHVTMEETVIVDNRSQEQVVEGFVQEEVVEVVNKDGWQLLYNEKIYGGKHQYYHQEVATMTCMDRVHLENPAMAHQYLNMSGRSKSQGVFFDMELNTSAKTMEQWADIIDMNDHLEDISLVWYENRNLNAKLFAKFLTALSKQRRLRRLSVNLRWCTQICDDWMEKLGAALPEHLEYLEVWVNGCRQVTNVGLKHMMQNMTRCGSLSEVKFYTEGTGMTTDHQSNFKSFMTERKFRTMRMVGCGMDVDHRQ